jgi:hypothetical protein
MTTPINAMKIPNNVNLLYDDFSIYIDNKKSNIFLNTAKTIPV